LRKQVDGLAKRLTSSIGSKEGTQALESEILRLQNKHEQFAKQTADQFIETDASLDELRLELQLRSKANVAKPIQHLVNNHKRGRDENGSMSSTGSSANKSRLRKRRKQVVESESDVSQFEPPTPAAADSSIEDSEKESE